MPKVIMWKKPDGTLSMVHPAPNGQGQGESESDWLDRVAAKSKPDPAATRTDIEKTDLPSRYFRASWGEASGLPAVDMPKARLQKMDMIRDSRNMKLTAADGPTARENEQNGPDKAAWNSYKQSLRDLPSLSPIGDTSLQ